MGVYFPKTFRTLQDHVEKLYQDESILKDIVRFRILLNGSKRIVALTIRLLACFSFAITILVAFPFYDYLQGNRPLVIQVILPFLDFTSGVGYYVNILYELINAVLCICGFVSSDIWYMMMILIYRQCLEFVEQNCHDLGDLMERKIDSPMERKIYLRNIILQFHDLDQWVSKI